MQDLIKYIFKNLDLEDGGDIELHFVTENSNKSQKQSFGRKSQLRTWSHLEIYHSIQVREIGMCLCYCWKDLNEQDLYGFIL
jgi:hypothetical protein